MGIDLRRDVIRRLVVTKPHGLFVCRGPGPTPRAEVDFDFVRGWLVRPDWKDIEPNEGQYDWSYVDQELGRAKRFGKRITLALMGGPQSPTWLYDNGVRGFTWEFSSPFWPSATLRIPIMWDAAYLTKWCGLIREAGARYRRKRTIELVHITAATANGLEMQLPDPVLAKWVPFGYSEEILIRSWQRVIDAFAESFPATPLDLDVHPVLGTNRIAEQVTQYAHENLGDRFGVFGGWLSGKTADQDKMHAGMHVIARTYGALTFADFQLIGNQTRQPQRFAPGGIRAAIRQGMSWGARYFEVWQTDVTNPALQPVLRELAKRLD